MSNMLLSLHCDSSLSWLVVYSQEGIECLICTSSLRGDSGQWEAHGQKREGEEVCSYPNSQR